MSQGSFDRVALIGIGLIGSSLARALRRDSPDTLIVVCARRAETLATVRRLELADETTDDPAAAASGTRAFSCSMCIAMNGDFVRPGQLAVG